MSTDGIPGYILSLAPVPRLSGIETVVTDLLSGTRALRWDWQSDGSDEVWILYETEGTAVDAHHFLHRSRRPLDLGGRWRTALVGTPSFALGDSELDALLARLVEYPAPAPPPAATVSKPTCTLPSHPQPVSSLPPRPSISYSDTSSPYTAYAPSSDAAPFQSSAQTWKGEIHFGDCLKRRPEHCDRLGCPRLRPGCVISEAFVRDVLECGIGRPLMSDIYRVDVRPRFDDVSRIGTVTQLYNLDLSFVSREAVDRFHHSAEREAAITYMNAHHCPGVPARLPPPPSSAEGHSISVSSTSSPASSGNRAQVERWEAMPRVEGEWADDGEDQRGASRRGRGLGRDDGWGRRREEERNVEESNGERSRKRMRVEGEEERSSAREDERGSWRESSWEEGQVEER